MLPFVSVAAPVGVRVLLPMKPGMTWVDVAWQIALATAALAAACHGWLVRALAGWDRPPCCWPSPR